MKLPKLFSFRGTPTFVSDGCSGYMTWTWNALFGRNPPWNGVCILHDAIYWGGYMSRRAADTILFEGVCQKGCWTIAWLMWCAVRIGGSRFLPFSWRWRYRESYWHAITVPEVEHRLHTYDECRALECP